MPPETSTPSMDPTRQEEQAVGPQPYISPEITEQEADLVSHNPKIEKTVEKVGQADEDGLIVYKVHDPETNLTFTVEGFYPSFDHRGSPTPELPQIPSLEEGQAAGWKNYSQEVNALGEQARTAALNQSEQEAIMRKQVNYILEHGNAPVPYHVILRRIKPKAETDSNRPALYKAILIPEAAWPI